MHAGAIAPGKRSCQKRTPSTFFVWPEKKGGSSAPSEPPLAMATCLKGVSYRVPCKECDAVYIGETLRNLEERLKEHKRHVEKSDLKGSAIAEHVLKTGHSIAWDKAQVIDYEQRWGARKIKESLHIKRERANRQLMNRDGGLAISRVWQHVI